MQATFISTCLLIFSFSGALLATSVLEQDIKKHLSKQEYINVEFGISIKTPATNMHINDTQAFVPASIQKLLLSYYMIDTFGINHRFYTNFYYDKEHNIYIKGGADPTFQTNQFQEIIRKLKKKKIDQISSIILDPSIIERSPNEYRNKAHYYYAKAEGLNLNYNTISCTLNQKTSLLETIPSTGYAKLDLRYSSLKLSKKKASHPYTFLQKRSDHDNYVIKGEISRHDFNNKNLLFRVSQPSIFFGTVFKEECEKKNIKTIKKIEIRHFNKKKKKKLITIKSKPLHQQLKTLNQDSNNMVANCFTKYAGKSETNPKGSVGNGAKSIQAFLLSKLNINRNQWRIKDGAGLSKENKSSSNSILKVLNSIKEDKQIFNTVFLSMLNPEQDPLYKKLDIPKHLDIRIKTGTLTSSGIHNMAGYIINKETDAITEFAILTQSNPKEKSYYKAELTTPILDLIIQHTL
ncbi:D-alanyl-D-alanine carboxypeptidase/D-alanyl-D-alanine-endopeptidase [Candidatus Marinamargulisbacteria bacterium SCGC AG-343-D04]|nr:D-alanyl-D-alanine carboxypeptidase/D-alanyl-D-alanine-endopeptidase [Candidatus Marinamargulisbacteria bacterium SCGC AG-343-D04]